MLLVITKNVRKERLVKVLYMYWSCHEHIIASLTVFKEKKDYDYEQ